MTNCILERRLSQRCKEWIGWKDSGQSLDKSGHLQDEPPSHIHSEMCLELMPQISMQG